MTKSNPQETWGATTEAKRQWDKDNSEAVREQTSKQARKVEAQQQEDKK